MLKSYTYTISYMSNKNEREFKIGIAAEETPSVAWLAKHIKDFFAAHYKALNVKKVFRSIYHISLLVEELDGNKEWLDTDEIEGEDLSELLALMEKEVGGLDGTH